MGLYINYLLFIFLNISTILGHNHCPSSHCGGGNVTVHYPFKFEHEAPPSPANCAAYFNLTCNEASSTTIVNLPSGGEFYVQKIDYSQRYIQLYDPGNCLMGRLFDLSLESSPFKAAYDNFTLYTCPRGYSTHPILCLSNSTNITVVARGSSEDVHTCEVARTGPIPIDHDETFLFLSWDYDDCVKCGSGGLGSKIIAKIATVAMTLPGLVIMSLSCGSVFCFHLMKLIGGRYGAGSAEGPAPSATEDNNLGLEESQIVRCTKIIIFGEGEHRCKSTTCSICLENYCEGERVIVISKCDHCFHSDCIHRWLGKNRTCPVCRISISDDDDGDDVV